MSFSDSTSVLGKRDYGASQVRSPSGTTASTQLVSGVHEKILDEALTQLLPLVKDPPTSRSEDDKSFQATDIERVRSILQGTGPLDLSSLTSNQVNVLAALSEDGWKALHAARAPSNVVIPVNQHQWDALKLGLRHLLDIQKLTICSRTNEDLVIGVGPLRGTKLASLEMHDLLKSGVSFPTRRFQAHVWDGLQVTGHTNRFAGTDKSLVIYHDEKGAPIGKPRSMPGMPYWRRATASKLWNPKAAYEAAEKEIYTNNNNIFPFADPQLGLMRCQDLGTQWLMDRHAYHSQRKAALMEMDTKSTQGSEVTSPATHARFSMAGYVDQKAMTEHLDKGAITEARESMLAQKNWVQDLNYTSDQLGSRVSKAFKTMVDGDVQLWGSSHSTHFMAVEQFAKPTLRGTRACTDYVLEFYDPNVTMGHFRLVHDDPDKFASCSWASLLGNGTDKYDKKDDGFPLLYPYPPVTPEAAYKAVLQTPQHQLAGEQVMPAFADEAMKEKCRTQDLRSIAGGGPHHVVCASKDFRGIQELNQFRSPRLLETIPLATRYRLRQQYAEHHAVYLIPGDLLQKRED